MAAEDFIVEVGAAIGTAVAAGYAWLKRHTIGRKVNSLRANGGTKVDTGTKRFDSLTDIADALRRIERQNDDTIEAVEDLREDIERIEGKVDGVADVVYYLHEDDDAINDREKFQDALDVDPADDFLRGQQPGGDD